MSYERELHDALMEIERQLKIGMTELMHLAAQNMKLREAMHRIAWHIKDDEPDLGECMNIAERALEQD